MPTLEEHLFVSQCFDFVSLAQKRRSKCIGVHLVMGREWVEFNPVSLTPDIPLMRVGRPFSFFFEKKREKQASSDVG